MPATKIIAWDLETTNLNANFGYLLCGGWKVLGEKKAHVIDITQTKNFKKDCTNDKELCKRLYDVLSEADMWITWFGCYFDVPYLNSRLLRHDLPPLPPVPHLDGWKVARYKLKLNSNRLQSVTSFLGLDDKTPLDGPTWVRAMAGHRKSIRYVVEHCRQDCEVLEQVYQKLKPLAQGHPNLNLLQKTTIACPRCGANKLQCRGTQVTTTQVYQRFHCTACGGWSRARRAEPTPHGKVEVR